MITVDASATFRHNAAMGTGLFGKRSSNQGLNFRAGKAARAKAEKAADPHAERPMDRRIDVFAAALARHGDAQRAAREMGLSPSSGNGMLQRLRRDLGAQAS